MSQLFKDLGLSKRTLEAITKKGFITPSPIQASVIPLLLEDKKNIIGQAQTGTGKTAAFGLPLIEKLSHESYTQALVLAPTRELAMQVAEEINSFQSEKKLNVVTIYGGQSYTIQINALRKGADIIVGTPGRVIDHLHKGNIKLQKIKYFILDEADEMLNMGFLDDIKEIFEQTNPEKRVLLFSATMPREIINVAKHYMGEYELIEVKKDELNKAKIDQFYIQVSERDKLEALCRLMDKEDDFYGIVFCKTKVDVDHVFQKLHEKKYSAQALHGDVQQKQRESILKSFKTKKTKILVATDVAARGIDVNDITHVINFALPGDVESYTHRIGRTGRAGKTGVAITFITSSEFRKLMFFQKDTKSDIKKMEIPAIEHIIEAKKKKLKTNIESVLEKGSHEKYLPIAKELLLEKDADQIVASLLRIAYANELNEENYHAIEKVSVNTQGKARLFIALGKKDGYYPKTMVEFIEETTSVPSREIDDVRVMEDFSFITVPDSQSEIIINALKGKASRAKADKGGSSSGSRSGGYERRGGFGGSRGGERSFGGDRGNRDRGGDKGGYRGERKPFQGPRNDDRRSNDKSPRRSFSR